MLLKTVMLSYSVGSVLGSEFENRRLFHVSVLCIVGVRKRGEY